MFSVEGRLAKFFNSLIFIEHLAHTRCFKLHLNVYCIFKFIYVGVCRLCVCVCVLEREGRCLKVGVSLSSGQSLKFLPSPARCLANFALAESRTSPSSVYTVQWVGRARTYICTLMHNELYLKCYIHLYSAHQQASTFFPNTPQFFRHSFDRQLTTAL